MPIYATPAELAAYIDPDAEVPAIPEGATVKLRRASQLVLEATAGALYRTDGDGLPVDARKREAMREATMEQASAWVAAGIDPTKGIDQLPRVAQSKSQGGVSVTYQADGARDEERRLLASGSRLTSTAESILASAGLLSYAIQGARAVETFAVRMDPYDPLTGQLYA